MILSVYHVVTRLAKSWNAKKPVDWQALNLPHVAKSSIVL